MLQSLSDRNSEFMIFVQKSNKQNGFDLFGEQSQNKTWTETAALSKFATAKAVETL